MNQGAVCSSRVRNHRHVYTLHRGAYFPKNTVYILYFTQAFTSNETTPGEKLALSYKKTSPLSTLSHLRNDGKRSPYYTVRVALSVVVHGLLGNGAGGRHLFPTTGHVVLVFCNYVTFKVRMRRD